MYERFLGALPSLPVQKATSHAAPEDITSYGGGRRISLDQAELENANLRMIISTLAPAEHSFGTPKEMPLHLLFVRMLFSRLRELECCPMEEDPSEERLPVDAFHRAFERLFFLIGDPSGFHDRDDYPPDPDGCVAWDEFFQVYQRRDLRIRPSLCERIYLTLESPDPAEAPLLARIVSGLVLMAVVLSSFVTILATLPELRGRSGRPEGPTARLLQRIDEACLLIFSLEYAARLLTCWAVRSEIFDRSSLLQLVASHDPIRLPSALGRLIRFVLAPSNLVDLAAILPGIIAFFVKSEGNGLVVLRLVKLTRIFRALKNPALVEPVVVLARTMEQSTMALYFLLFNLMLGIMIFGSLMYLVEGQGIWDMEQQRYMRRVGRRWNDTASAWEDVLKPSPFQSIPHTFWWAMVTTATVGYGDHYPTTSLGYSVAALTMAFSLVITALPVGLIGVTFDRVWEEYAREKRKQEDNSRRHLSVVASAIQRLDPGRISSLMLVEVWHDRADLGGTLGPRDCFTDFMGEVRLKLELPADTRVSKRLTLPLQANKHVVPRAISGSVTVAYTWTPHTPDARVEDGSRPPPSQKDYRHCGSCYTDVQPRGTLEVSIVSGDRLINLEANRHRRFSSAFCLVFVYPTCPDPTGAVAPCVWRTATAMCTLSPRWFATHCFEYDWYESRHIMRRWSSSRTSEISMAMNALSRVKSVEEAEEVPSAEMGKAVAMIKQLGGEVQTVKEELHELSDRVDRLLDKVQGWPDDLTATLTPIKGSVDQLLRALGDLE